MDYSTDNFFLEMQPHERAFDEDGQEIISEQRIVNEWIIQQGLPTIITTDAHYLAKEHRKFHKAYLTSDNDEDKASVREVDSFYATTYHMDTEEIHSYLNHYIDESLINQCIDNAWNIEDKASVREVDSFYATTYHMDTEEIHSYLNHYIDESLINQCIDNAWNIAQRVKGYNLIIWIQKRFTHTLITI